MKTCCTIFLAVSLTNLWYSPNAFASIIGDTVQVTMEPSGIWSVVPGSATVIDPGSEFGLVLNNIGEFFRVDIAASYIAVSYSQPAMGLSTGAGELLTISDLDWLPTPAAITAVSLSVFGAITGLVESDVTFTNDSVSVDMNHASYGPGSSFRLDFQTANIAAVPEAASMFIWFGFAATVAGLAFYRRRST